MGGDTIPVSQSKGLEDMAFDKAKYDNDFIRQNYDTVKFLIPKGKKQILKAYADSQGKSMSQIIVEALEAHCKLDLAK